MEHQSLLFNRWLLITKKFFRWATKSQLVSSRDSRNKINGQTITYLFEVWAWFYERVGGKRIIALPPSLIKMISSIMYITSHWMLILIVWLIWSANTISFSEEWVRVRSWVLNYSLPSDSLINSSSNFKQVSYHLTIYSVWIVNALSIVCSEMLKLSRNNPDIKMFGVSPNTLPLVMYIEIFCYWVLLHYNMSFNTISRGFNGAFWWYGPLSENVEKL